MTKIKICGLFLPRDIDFVNAAQPDYAGFVFAKSRREIGEDAAREFRKRLDPSIQSVGVFVDAPVERVLRLYDDGVIDVAQLHGQEDSDYIAELKKHTGLPVIKAIRVDSREDILRAKSTPADYPLLDNGAGGTGARFDWSLIKGLDRPYFLAGGIGADNIDRAFALCPYCIDVSSGAETEGVKDENKIRHLVIKTRGGAS
ncbi:MAG: phosphoribosylanthranilate isomerase [Bacillota bacterium]